MKLSEMSDNHLINAIAYLRKNIDNYRGNAINSGYQTLCAVQGEQAQLDIEQGINYYERASRQELLTEMGYYKLLAEKRKRKLQ